MAIVEIKKLELIGLNSERERILSALSKTKVFEVAKTAHFEGLHSPDIHNKGREDNAVKMAKLSFGINFVSSKLNELRIKLRNIKKAEKKAEKKGIPYNKCEYSYVPEKQPFMGGRKIVSEHEFETVYTREYELFGSIDELEKLNFRLIEINNEIRKKKQLLEELKPYVKFETKLSVIKDTKYTKAVFGHLPLSRYFTVADIRSDNPDASISINQSGKWIIVTLIAAENFDKVLQELSDAGFEKCKFNFDVTAHDKTEEFQKDINKLNDEYLALLNGIQDYNSKYKEFQLYYDYLMLENERQSAIDGLMVTNQAFVLEGFFPAGCEEKISNVIYEITNVVNFNIRKAEVKDNPPTLLINRTLIEPYESITQMYAPPSYNEPDPNMFVAFFYFIFFGLMLGDAGYGLILSIATFIILKLCRVEKGTKRLLKILCMGGISTIVWGLLMGGVFSISGVPALWFNPMDDPIILLILALGLGFLHLMFGLGINGYKLIKQGKPWSALFDVGLIYLLFIGIGAMATGIMLKFPTLKLVGMIILICALAGMVLTQGRSKPTIAGKVIGGFASLYNLVNYVSDILSYCRVFGLGLATAVIGMVANTIAGVMFNLVPVIGHIFGIFFLLLLHGINIAINTLSAYVHTSRLQFIEFFGKFYEGGGRMFRPLGINTKYTRIEPVKAVEKTN